MVRQKNYLCVLGALITFAAVLVLNGGFNLPAAAPDAVSAPSIPRTSVEAAPAAHLLQSHSGGCGLAPFCNHVALSPDAVHARLTVRPVEIVGQAHYGPLHRRPPPSFS